MKHVAFLSLFFFFGFAAHAQINTLEPGDVAPDFKLMNIDGEMISLEDYPQAKGFIVVFTANTCPYAIAYEERLIALDRKFAPRGYPVIAINPNPPALSAGDRYEKMQEKAQAQNFSFPYLFDESQEITNQYGARVTPHVFLLQKEGDRNRVMYTGAVDNDTQDVNEDKIKYVENAIDQIETGQPIEVASTKAIGCTVKRPKTR